MKVPHDLDHARVESQILRCAAAGNHEPVVFGGIDIGEVGVEREVVARLLAIGLLPLEVMDCGGDLLARLAIGTNGVDFVADHQQHLEGDHDFVVFDEVTDEEENAFFRHGIDLGAFGIECDLF